MLEMDGMVIYFGFVSGLTINLLKIKVFPVGKVEGVKQLNFPKA